jgi:hypothetical protein
MAEETSATEIRWFGEQFTWEELVAQVRLGAVNVLPPLASLTPPDGRYVTDHLSATRAMVALVASHTRRGGPADMGGGKAVAVRLEAALIQLARAETAAQDAAFCLLDRRLATVEAAKAFVDARVGALHAAAHHLARAHAQLADAISLVDGYGLADDGGEGADEGGSLADDSGGGGGPQPADGGAGAKQPSGTAEGKEKEKPKDEKPAAKTAVADALAQTEATIDTINAIVAKLAPPDKKDQLADLVAAVAKAIVKGAKDALISALTALLKAIDSDAKPEDIIVDGKADDGYALVYFRVRKGCLLVLDWAVSDDHVFVHKIGKTGEYSFVTGDPAKALGKAAEEELVKRLRREMEERAKHEGKGEKQKEDQGEKVK